MIGVALKGLASRKLRALLTAFAKNVQTIIPSSTSMKTF